MNEQLDENGHDPELAGRAEEIATHLRFYQKDIARSQMHINILQNTAQN